MRSLVQFGRARKVSERERKQYRDAVARNEAAIAEALTEVKLNKHPGERITENLKS